jgi:hypothetical protein
MLAGKSRRHLKNTKRKSKVILYTALIYQADPYIMTVHVQLCQWFITSKYTGVKL